MRFRPQCSVRFRSHPRTPGWPARRGKPIPALAGVWVSLAMILMASLLAERAQAFEGRITAAVTQAGQTAGLLYTVRAHRLRIERTETNRPYAKDLVDLDSGSLTLLFPHNRSFVRLKGQGPKSRPANRTAPPGLVLPQAALPLGIGPRPGSSPAPGVAPVGLPAMMPLPPPEPLELKATGQPTNLLGFVVQRYALKQLGQVLEVWATSQLFPFAQYLEAQSPHFGSPRLDEQWPALLKARGLFPLRVSLHLENGPELYHLEVTAVEPEQFHDPAGQLFEVPVDYHELEPLPF